MMKVFCGCVIHKPMQTAMAVMALLLLAACARVPNPVQFITSGNPEKLSDWRVVLVDDNRLALNAGVEVYELTTPLFSDYAHKLRTVWMPKGAAATYHSDKTFDFPIGTIISKTFYYPIAASGDKSVMLKTNDSAYDFLGQGLDLTKVHLVETRLLVRRQEGWLALPYVWNDAQTDAELARSGDEKALKMQDAEGHRHVLNYVVPNTNQCAGCHGTDNKLQAIEPIGPKARHLNRDHAYESGIENQLAHLMKVGYLIGVPNVKSAPRSADWQDGHASIDQRARAYLDINCAHCHSPNGPANTSGLWLDNATTDSIRLGVCKPPVAAGQGTGDHLFGIVPGHPEQSILAYRLASTDPGAMMPEVGRGLVHAEGVALINQWIAAMPGTCEAP